MRKPGKISPNKAARMLGVHPNTVRNWASKVLEGQVSCLRNVEKNKLTRYVFISLSDVNALKKKIEE